MPQWMQGMMIGLLISLLLGIVVGFYLRQRQVNRLTAALKTSQDREKVLQQEHEIRLRDATAQLQQDYEAQLADKIERYQQQYEIQRQQLEAEYEARQNLRPGRPGGASDPQDDPDATAEPWETAPTSEYEIRLRQQYEARLKEAAQKIQHAYEQHLRETLATEREAQQQEYDQRLAEAIARYQDEADERLAEALKEQNLVTQAEGSGLVPGLGDETQIQDRLANLEAELRRDYDRRLAERIEQYQDEMSQRMAQLEQDFAARLQMAQATQSVAELPPVVDLPANAGLEARFQAEYDQRLTDAVARHQDEMTERLTALEQDYEARLRMATGGADPDLEANLRQEIEAELRVEYGVTMAEKLEQVQADLNQRTQDFEAGLIATMDPFVDAAIEAEALEDDGFMNENSGDEDSVGENSLDENSVNEGLGVDPFPDLDALSVDVPADDPFSDLDALQADVPADESPEEDGLGVDPFADLDALPADSLVDSGLLPSPMADQALATDLAEGGAVPSTIDVDGGDLDVENAMADNASVDSPGLDEADLQDFGFDLSVLGGSDAGEPDVGESNLGGSALEDAGWETSGLDESGFGDLDFGDSGLGDLGLEDAGLDDAGLGQDWEAEARGADDLANGALGKTGSAYSEFQGSELGEPDSGEGESSPGPEAAAAELDLSFNLDDLDLSALSEDDLPLNDGGEADIFNLETLAQQAGVDLEELNDLLQQSESSATEGESTDFSDEDWGSLS